MTATRYWHGREWLADYLLERGFVEASTADAPHLCDHLETDGEDCDSPARTRVGGLYFCDKHKEHGEAVLRR